MKYLALFLLALTASAQTAFDPTQSGAYPAYPAYLDHWCGGISLTVYEQAGDHYAVRAYTNCSTGGRGTRPRRYLACWDVTAPDGYYITERTLMLYATWLMGTQAQSCPPL